MTRWRIEKFWHDDPALETYLNLGWEPFAVLIEDGEPRVWLRMAVDA